MASRLSSTRTIAALALVLAAPFAIGSIGAKSGLDQRLLAAHNRERAALGVAPLAWSPALAADARAWGAQLARRGVMEHSDVDPEDPDPQGENLWMGTRNAFAPEEMVGLWIAEKKHFKPGVFPNVSRTGDWDDVGHYTQVAWRDTRQVGCAVATGAREDFLVCRYAQGGNVEGERPF